MHIHNSDSDFLVRSGYIAKELLKDSFERTERGLDKFKNSQDSGLSDVLLGRIESAAACALVAFGASCLIFASALAGPLFLIPAIALNGASRLAWISSFESVKKFTSDSSDVIYRSIKVGLILPAASALFLSSSLINTFIPSLLKADNLFSTKLRDLVKSLGPLITVEAHVSKNSVYIGTEDQLSFLGAVEEFSRSLSFDNQYKKVFPYRVYHHYHFTINR